MKRYLLFIINPEMEAGGGWHDFHADWNDLNLCFKYLKNIPQFLGYEFHIVDTTRSKKRIIAKGTIE
jgi:hypothetical protein